MVRPADTGSTSSVISNDVIWVMFAVLGDNACTVYVPLSSRNWPWRENSINVLAKGMADSRKLIRLPPHVRSMGSSSTTVCTVLGKKRS